MTETTHSDYGRLKSVFLRSAENAFRSQQKIDAEWQALHYWEKPDFEKARADYALFEQIFRENGTEIHHFSADDSLSLDALYVRDASLLTDKGVIVARPGKIARQAEAAAAEAGFQAAGLKILGKIEAPGTFEGGDAAWIDENTLGVAEGYRTNAEGIRQLRAFLEPEVSVVVMQSPHFRGPSDVFHLMSVFSPVDRDLAVIYSPLMSVTFRNLLLEKGYRFVEVPEEEFDSLGCNVLALAPSKCLIAKGNPKTKAALEAAGAEVIEYEGREISYKGCGGPTCLTRPVIREI